MYVGRGSLGFGDPLVPPTCLPQQEYPRGFQQGSLLLRALMKDMNLSSPSDPVVKPKRRGSEIRYSTLTPCFFLLFLLYFLLGPSPPKRTQGESPGPVPKPDVLRFRGLELGGWHPRPCLVDSG